MVISALLIIGGLLVVILSLPGDFMSPTTGILVGTILFVFGLIVLRRQKTQIHAAESRIRSFEEGSNIADPGDIPPSDGMETSQALPDDHAEFDQDLIHEPEPDLDKSLTMGETENDGGERNELIEEDPLEDEENVNDEGQATEDVLAASPPPVLPPIDPEPPIETAEPEFVKVASIDEVKVNACHSVDVNGIQIVLFNLDGEFFAMRDNCSHARARLSAGDIEGNEIVCPLHGATFNIRTGEATGPPAYNGVKTYQVRVTGSDLELEV